MAEMGAPAVRFGFGPVQNGFSKILSSLNLEPDRRSGSFPAPNLGPDHGQVREGSGSNHGSEPNLTNPRAAVGSLIIRRTLRPEIVPASFVADVASR
jgi:hypothetical protein